MKKIKYLLPIIILLFTINVEADDLCSSEELKRLQDLANKVEISYQHHLSVIDENDYEVYYSIKVLNMSDDIQLRYDKKRITTIENLEDVTYTAGNNFVIYVYAYTEETCPNVLLRTITINFPYYNLWYYKNKDKCQQNPQFKYCKEFFEDKYVDYDNIEKLYNEYIKNDNDIINKLPVKNNLILYIAIPLTIVIVIVVVIIIRNRKKKYDI